MVQVRKRVSETGRPARVSGSERKFASSVQFHPSVTVP